MTRYSALALAAEGLRRHRGWPSAWRKAAPQAAYDAIVVGGGAVSLPGRYLAGPRRCGTP